MSIPTGTGRKLNEAEARRFLPYTDQQLEEFKSMAVQYESNTIQKRKSIKNKFKALGLTEDEIKMLIKI